MKLKGTINTEVYVMPSEMAKSFALDMTFDEKAEFIDYVSAFYPSDSYMKEMIRGVISSIKDTEDKGRSMREAKRFLKCVKEALDEIDV